MSDIPDISIILITAREAYNTIIGLPETHILGPCIESLRYQTFKDFELIVVDSLHEYRTRMFEGEPFGEIPFPVRHVPVHPNHRFWLNRRRFNASGAMNTGFLYAEGELVVKMDDCCQFGPDLLERMWEEYQSGYFPMVMHTRYRGGKQAYFDKEYKEKGYEVKATETAHHQPQVEKELSLKVLSEVYPDGAPIRDSRWNKVETAGGRLIGEHNQFYGYSGFSLDAALKVNGFDELLDGDTSQMDVDFGVRLWFAGYQKMFILDKDMWVIEHEHGPVSSKVIDLPCENIKCNHAVMLNSINRNHWRAHSYELTEKEIEEIVAETLRPPCSPNQGMFQDDCKGPLFNLWKEHKPIFSLRDERVDIL